MPAHLLLSLAFVIPTFLVAVLRRTRAFCAGGFLALALGFLGIAGGSAVAGAMAVLAGILLVVYGFVLLGVGAMLFRRHLDAQPEIPRARAKRA